AQAGWHVVLARMQGAPRAGTGRTRGMGSAGKLAALAVGAREVRPVTARALARAMAWNALRRVVLKDDIRTNSIRGSGQGRVRPGVPGMQAHSQGEQNAADLARGHVSRPGKRPGNQDPAGARRSGAALSMLWVRDAPTGSVEKASESGLRRGRRWAGRSCAR